MTPRPDPVPPFHLDPVRMLAFRTPVQDQPGLADTKAAAVLTVSGLLFTLVARFGDAIADVVRGAGANRYAALGLLVGFAVLGVGAVVQAFRTISPRFPKAPESLAFFQTVAALERDEYVSRVLGLSLEDVVQHVLTYNHTLATICVEKYRQLRLCIQLFRGAFFCWLGLMGALAVHVWA